MAQGCSPATLLPPALLLVVEQPLMQVLEVQVLETHLQLVHLKVVLEVHLQKDPQLMVLVAVVTLVLLVAVVHWRSPLALVKFRLAHWAGGAYSDPCQRLGRVDPVLRSSAAQCS